MKAGRWLLLTLLSLAGTAHAADAAPRAPCTCPCADPEGAPDDAEARAERAPVDLNQASESALLALPGIGPARARAILAYRAERGGFRSVSQLLHIRGIGRALLRKLRPLVTTGLPRAPREG